MEQCFRFSVYEHNLVLKDNQIVTRKFIVLKDSDERIVQWTDFHRYIKEGKTKYAKSVSSDGNKRAYYICKFLNHIFFHFQIKSLTDVTIEMVQDFLNRYGLAELTENDCTRNESSVNICVRYVIDFLEEISIRYPKKMKFQINDLYKKKQVYTKQGKLITKKIPAFDVNYYDKPNEIFRDMPEKVFSIFLNVVATKHTNLLMLVALSAFAGLRPSEACNIRREDSQLGPGIILTEVNGEVEDISLDLTCELNLRSDLKRVGSIKKERTQKVYPAFRSAFYDCYKKYMKFIEGKKYEIDYGALTTNKQGKAITYYSYYNSFKQVIADMIPELLNSNDAETVNYGHLLMERNISPHILRHWYSVKLTLFGEDVASLMYWRGDKSPTSALTYLQNKGDLEKQYQKMNDKMLDYHLWASKKMLEDQYGV